MEAEKCKSGFSCLSSHLFAVDRGKVKGGKAVLAKNVLKEILLWHVLNMPSWL
jgi:hypothetical protein